MVIGAETHCFGMRLEKEKVFDQTYGKKLRDEFVW
jgi:hypothetical protein